MFARVRIAPKGARPYLAALMGCAVLTVTLATAAPSANALGTSKFCTTLLSGWGNAEKYVSEAPTSVTSYHTWAKDLLPFYEALENSAPNAATKTELGYVVTILKYLSNQTSLAKIEAYSAANHAKFEAGTKALAKAVESCA